MQDASFNSSISANTNIATQGQINSSSINSDAKQTQASHSVFSKNAGMSDVNQSNSNSQGSGGLVNIFAGGGLSQQASFDNTSIFAGMNRGTHYALYSKKDSSYDVPKLTQEDVENQKTFVGERKTNPKPYNIDMTPKANPFEAFRNPEYQEESLGEKISNAISGIFGSKSAS